MLWGFSSFSLSAVCTCFPIWQPVYMSVDKSVNSWRAVPLFSACQGGLNINHNFLSSLLLICFDVCVCANMCFWDGLLLNVLTLQVYKGNMSPFSHIFIECWKETKCQSFFNSQLCFYISEKHATFENEITFLWITAFQKQLQFMWVSFSSLYVHASLYSNIFNYRREWELNLGLEANRNVSLIIILDLRAWIFNFFDDTKINSSMLSKLAATKHEVMLSSIITCVKPPHFLLKPSVSHIYSSQ